MMDLQAALGGAGGGPPGMGPPGGAPAEIMVPPPEAAAGPAGPPGLGPEAGGSSLDFLDAAEDALNEFIAVDPDEVDRAEASKALQIVLKLKATNQTDAEQGGMKSLRKALAGGGGAPVGGPPLG